MTLISYNLGIPNAPNNPSNDQPNMKDNNDHIAQFVAVDHIPFNVNKSGIHKQVTLLNESAPGLGSGNGVLYSNIYNGQSRPIWQDAIGSTILISSATSRAGNGYASLPGQVLLQWGSAAIPSTGTGTINFNIPFAIVGGFDPIVTIAPFTAGSPTLNIYLTATTNANFSYINESASVFAIHWHAIGPI